MRINKYIAASSILSRRAADQAILDGRVTVNGKPPLSGVAIAEGDVVTLDNVAITPAVKTITIMINKPVGYVCSRNGQGSPTIYELIPRDYQSLQPVGRLDKDSSGLLLMTTDGDLANQLTHPSFEKTKVYEIRISKPLDPLHQKNIANKGVTLEDGRSQLKLKTLNEERTDWQVTMHEGRNRQIRRTFDTLGYHVTGLKRVKFGDYNLAQLAPTQRYVEV